MKFELFIAQRLSFKGDKTKSTSPSINIAVAGIAMAIVIMTVAIVVVLGFKHEIRQKVMGFDAQITILPLSNTSSIAQSNYINFNDSLQSIVSTILPDAEISLSIKNPCILKTDDNFLGVILKGMDSNHDWSFVNSNIIDGEIPDYNNNENANKIIISKSISAQLNLKVKDKIFAYYFLNNNIRTRRYEIAAIYESHFGEYDKLMTFGSIKALQQLNNLPQSWGNQLEIRNIPNDLIYDKNYEIQNHLYNANHAGEIETLYSVENIYHRGAIYFNWLSLLDTNVIVILILMSIVSCFTLISSMFIIILERVNMIGIMKSLGCTNAQLQRIFINMTQRLVLKGLIIGNIIAISLILIQDSYHILPLDPESYYLSYVPVKINWLYLVLLNIGVVITSYLTLILPSKLIAKISPAKTIRYE